MSQYDIVALGNALVDKEFEVTEEFLAKHNIEKGFMTLQETDEHVTLIEDLHQEFGLRNRAGGGSAANTIVTAAQFGSKTFYCCKVANDDLGDFYRRDLDAASVDNSLSKVKVEGMTGLSLIMVTPDADRTMCTHLGITGTFSDAQLDLNAIQNAKYLYIEGHLLYQPPAVEAILKAKAIAQESGVKVAVTFSDPAVVNYARENLEKVLGDGVDLIFCNQDEATDWNGDLEKGIESILTRTKSLVLTRGESGATVYDNGEITNIEPFKVNAVDTTGAGDTFAGAFLYGITQGLSVAQSGKLASRTAAECVSSFGARLTERTQSIILQEMNF
ncbi:adenosine kinase [Alteromonadaceae bacterium M269]|nr:adenosine kinase [Alteromonadaceae bacterium M269]